MPTTPSLFDQILQSPAVTSLAGGVVKIRRVAMIFLYCVLSLLVFLVLLSYSQNDPAWSHLSDNTSQITNIGGKFGAIFADVLYLFFGVSAWLLIVFLVFEAYRLYANVTRPTVFLRLPAYVILWSALACVGFGVASFFDVSDNTLFGVAGFELFSAFKGFLGAGLTILFMLFVSFVLIWLIADKPTKPTPKPVDTQDVPEQDTTISFDETPIDLGIPPAMPAPQGILSAFLVQTGLSDDIKNAQNTSTQSPKNTANQNTAPKQQASAWSKPIQNHQTVSQMADSLSQNQSNKATNNQKTATNRTTLDNEQKVQEKAIKEKTVKEKESKYDGLFAKLNIGRFTKNRLKSNNIDNDSQHVDDLQNTQFTNQDIDKNQNYLNTNQVIDNQNNYQDDDLYDNYQDDYQVNHHQVNSYQDDYQTDSYQTNSQDKNSTPTSQKNIFQDHFDDTDDVGFNVYGLHNQPKAKPTQAVECPIDMDDPSMAGKSMAMAVASQRASLSAVPSLDLLDPVAQQVKSYSTFELQQLSELLEIKLKEFNINASVVNAIQGPIVTRFEVELAAGVQAAKVTRISDDLARNMSMLSLRVVSIIPGKPYIGIEVPNKHIQTIKLIELLHDKDFNSDEIELAMAMGKDISGNPVITNLAKAPHMLVAGTTGSGKSVLVNSMLLSMLLKYTPDELRLILIDPKMLEFANYADIPHLLTPVVTDMTEATAALSWCVGEMERRYQLMAFLKVRKLSEFNKKVLEAEQSDTPLLDPLWQAHDSVSQDKPPKLKPLPLITVVADEFADLIMQIGKPVEELITRLAQKSRAAGIHLILATQRPSTDVVTGLIKANIPVRVALMLKTMIDSRTILDMGGAEKLLGNGDMLFIGPGKNTPERLHGAFVTDGEVNRVCDAWRLRGAPDYIETVTANTDFVENSSRGGGSSGGEDVLYEDALAFVLDTGKTSTSGIQRKLGIGYNRAANIMESLERNGIVSKPDNAGRRTIL